MSVAAGGTGYARVRRMGWMYLLIAPLVGPAFAYQLHPSYITVPVAGMIAALGAYLSASLIRLPVLLMVVASATSNRPSRHATRMGKGDESNFSQ